MAKYRIGHVVWRELMTGDLEVAKRFYGGLFGWGFEVMPMEFGPYLLAHQGGPPLAGIMAGKTHCWVPYISVPDVDSAVAAASSLGAEVSFGPETVPGVGRLASLVAADGAWLGLMRSHDGDEDSPPPGPNRPCWESVQSPDPAAARRFFAAVCGWKDHPGRQEELPDFAAPDGTAVADHQAAERGAFMSHFQVDELEPMVVRVEALGGQVEVRHLDVPGVGSVATVLDPGGSRFGLYQPA